MTSTVRQLVNPTPEEIEEISNVASRAYRDDKALQMMIDGNYDLIGPLMKAMIRATALEGEIHVISEDNRIVSYCLWFLPGKDLFETEEQRALGFNEVFEKLSPAAQDWWKNKYMQTVGGFINGILKPRHFKDSWYVYSIATEIEYRKRGNATALLKHVIETRVEKGGFLALCAAYNEYSDFYQKVGFTLRGETQLKGPTGDTEVSVYFLSKDM